MIIHFSILLVILLVSAFYEHSFKANKIRVIADGGFASDYLGSILPWLIVFGYITFLAGMRTNTNDTYVYKDTFINLVPSWDGISEIVSSDGKDKGFSIAATLFKMLVSEDYHAWFIFVAAIESLLIINVVRRESVSFFDTCFVLFVTLYFNYFTMMRQWIAVSIVFWASRFIKKRKFIPYLFFCLLAAQFHNSAFFMIIVYFMVTGKAWSKKQLWLVVLFSISMMFLQPILNAVGFLAEDSTYNYVIDTMQTSTGSSFIRAVVAAAPPALAFIYRKNIRTDDLMVNVSVNMSLINMLMLILASFTSGIFVGRMSNYIQVYSMILVPYLFNVSIDEKNRSWIKALVYIGYFAFYIIQMNSSGSFYYGSDVLGYFI